MTRTLYCGDFPALQAKFVTKLGASRQREPLAPLDVLVPGHLLRLSLTRALAKSGCSHANIRFCTLPEFARQIAEPELRKEQRRLLPDVVRQPLLKEAIETNLPRLTYYGNVAPRRGFREALWRTLTELSHAGLSPALLATISGRSGAGVLARKLSDLVILWQAYHQLLARARYVDQVMLLLMARETWEQRDPPAHPLILYGLHDLSFAERGFLQTALHQRPASVYLPYRDLPSYSWVKPLYDWLCRLEFKPHFLPEPSEPVTRLLPRVQRHWMSARGEPLRIHDDDESLLIISAPGAPREAQEVVRELLFPAVVLPDPRSASLLFPGGDSLADLLREELTAAGAQAYVHEQRLADTIAGRSLKRLVRLLDGRFPRAGVMELFLSCPLRRLPSLPESLPAVPAAEWNHFSLLAGVTEGESSWNSSLTRLLTRLESKRASDDEQAAASERQLASLRALLRTLEWLFMRIREINAAPAWQAKSELFWRLFDELVVPDQTATILKREFEHATVLDRLQLPVTADGFAAFVDAALYRPVARSGRFQVNEPAVGTPAELLGVICDDLFITGVAEKQLPRPVPQDPLLLDDERTLLEQAARSLGAAVLLPGRARLKQREAFFFHSALTCATRRLVLSYSRLDLAKEGRERLPSSYLLRVLEAATGEPADYEALKRFIAQHGRRISINRLRAPMEPAASRFQYDMARLAEALCLNSFAPLADILAEGALGRAARADRLRFGGREFTAFDGLVSDESLRESLARDHAHRLSPTRLELYARCPFRFFAQLVLELEEIVESEPVRQISPLESGRLVHDILEHFYRSEQAAGRLPPEPDSLPRLLAAAEAQFVRFEKENPVGLPLLWQLTKREIIAVLTEYLQKEIARRDNFVPAHFERRYGNDPVLTYRLPDGTLLNLQGAVDRIDVTADGRARVIDYKTGKGITRLKSGELKGGTALQLPLYRLAVERLLGLDVESAAYHILVRGVKEDVIRFDASDWEKRRQDFHRILETIIDGVEHGAFFPWPAKEKCSHCPVRAACGSGRFTIKWRYEDVQTERLRKMSEIP